MMFTSFCNRAPSTSGYVRVTRSLIATARNVDRRICARSEAQRRDVTCMQWPPIRFPLFGEKEDYLSKAIELAMSTRPKPCLAVVSKLELLWLE